jgi:uncharacterized membrane protein YfcA
VHAIQFTATLFSVALAAGFLGSLTGLGGGVILTPVLTLLLGVDLRYAIGAALVSVIATSSGAAAAYVREGYSNVRVGMLLEVATTAGAIVGATIAGYVSTQVLAVIFGLVLLHSAWVSIRQPVENLEPDRIDPVAQKLRLDGCYPTAQGLSCYHVQHVGLGFVMMVIAGVLSGLLGIGSGALKVIAMDRAMRLPFKVSTTTSNFMIGVTAAASAGIYLNRGYIDPLLASPVMLGVLIGSMFGAGVLAKASPRILRLVFAALVSLMAAQMIISGLRGKI